MTNLNAKWTLPIIVAITLMLTTAVTIAGPVLAIKKSNTNGVKAIPKTLGKTITPKVHHLKGVKVSRMHTIPSKVSVGKTFSIRGIVFNNSTATITFANGTCTSPLSITFNKNVMIEPQTTTPSVSCKAQQVTLKPGEQSHILSPNLSGITYRATAPGTTNATITFKYGFETTTSKSPISDSKSRVFTFTIQPAGLRPSTTSEPSPAKLPIPLR